MSKDKWQGWLASNDLKVNLMNQLDAHCVCRVPISRQQSVPGSERLVWVPLLNHLTDDWRKELTDASILVAKLLLWHGVLLQLVVSLRELLGGINVGVHNMSFCVPEGNFSVCNVSSQLTQSAELQSMVDNMDAQWVFQGPGNLGPDSWLLLRRSDDIESE